MKHPYQVTCPFCAVGCRFKILKGMDEVVFSSRTQDVLDFDYENPVNEGALCPRGHFAYELLSHPQRLGQSYYRTNGKLEAKIPSVILKNITEKMAASSTKPPLAIFIDPMLSLHDIRAILDFASKNNIQAIDIMMPADRHLFRGMLDNPFIYKACDDTRILKKLNQICCVGDVFSKQPVMSRFLLEAKYAFRKNSFYSINPFPSRTGWFANIEVNHQPHLEPYLLAYLFNFVCNNTADKTLDKDLRWLQNFIKKNMKEIFQDVLTADQKQSLEGIANGLMQSDESGFLFSTHLYNASGSYLSGILSTAISKITNSYFIPLFEDSNLNAIKELAKDVYPHLNLGKQSTLHHVLTNSYQYLAAIGWNPLRNLPGNIQWPRDAKWIVSSVVQSEMPQNIHALFPQTHIFEQMDLRTNYLVWQSEGSEQVKSPIGSAETISQLIYAFHQKLTDNKISLSSSQIPKHGMNWRENFEAEFLYYKDYVADLIREGGKWFVPSDHVSHYKDGDLTRLSSWAQKDCEDTQLSISPPDAEEAELKDGQYFLVKYAGEDTAFKARIDKQLPKNLTVSFGHYLPARKIMTGEFANHNKEYYFWCPKIELKG